MHISLKNLYSLLCLFCCLICFDLKAITAEDLVENHVPKYNSNCQNIIPFTHTRTPAGSLKSSLLQLLKSTFGSEIFIETGTYLGETTAVAATIFNEVHTIELFPELFTQAQEKFRGNPAISVHFGNSADVFPQLLHSLSSPIFFYLDGHYSGSATALGESVTPILKELAAIREANIDDAVILIDDLRLFQKSLYPEKIAHTCLDGYPDLRVVVEEILKININYQICFLGDAIFAFPRSPDVSVSAVVEACALHRLASVFTDIQEQQLKKADITIANISDCEQEELLSYYNTFASWEMEMGFRSFGAMWYGLMLYQEGQYEAAQLLFEKAAEHSIPGWRVDQFLQDLVLHPSVKSTKI